MAATITPMRLKLFGAEYRVQFGNAAIGEQRLAMPGVVQGHELARAAGHGDDLVAGVLMIDEERVTASRTAR
jgi:hypothetical protein